MPVPLVTGRAVVLRGLTLDDVEDWLAGADEEQIRWLEFPRRSQRDDVVRAINEWNESWAAGGRVWQWGVCDRSSRAIVGGVELLIAPAKLVGLTTFEGGCCP